MSAQLSRMLSTLLQTPGDESTLEALAKWAEGLGGGDHGADVEKIEAAAADLARAGRQFEAAALLEVAAGPADGARKADLWAAVGRLQEEALHEPKRAVSSYRKALEAATDHPAAVEALARLEKLASEWKRVVERLEEEASAETEPTLRSQLYLRIAGIVESFGGKQKERASQVIGHLQNALRAYPSNHAAVRLLIRVMDKAKRLDDLAPQLAQLAAEAKVRDEKVALLVEGAKVYARLEQPDKAARLYQEVLDFVPGQPVALSFLVDYYTTLGDADRLVALYEDVLRARPRGESEIDLLFQIGMLHWRTRGDLRAAEEYFRRIRKSSPAHPAALNFYRSYCKETDDHARLLQILLDAQRVAETDDDRVRIHKEIATLAEDRIRNDERAIEAHKGILKIRPDDADAAANLRRLYRKTEKWNALIDLLKADLAAPDRDAAARIALLLEMVSIYADNLKSEMMVTKTYAQVLDLDPAHVGAFEALVRIFEGAKRWNDLIGLLGRRAEATADPGEKKALYRRSAEIWIRELNNFNNAVRPLEQIREIDPADPEAIAQLKDIYARRRAFPQLYELLLAELPALAGPRRIDQMIEMAQLAGERLDRRDEAMALWWQISDLDPARPGVLDAVQKLAERSKDSAAMAKVIGKRIEAETDDNARVALLLKAAALYQEKLADPAAASAAYRRVLSIQPGHPKATRMLKETFLAAGDYVALEELYTSLGDWEGLAEALGVAADRVSDRGLRIHLSLKAARTYEEKIKQPDRAFRAYERVLDADPAHRAAASALAGIYERQENWKGLAQVVGVLADVESDPAARLRLSRRLVGLYRDRIGDGGLAFEWARRCYDLAPADADVGAELERQAEDLKRFEDLLRIYEGRLPAASGEEAIALLRRIAVVHAHKLGDVDAAVGAYRRIMRELPSDERTVAELEDLLKTSGRLEALADLYGERIDAEEAGPGRLAWLAKLASLLDEGLDRTEEAIGAYRRILDAEPDDSGALAALERIYSTTGDSARLAEILERMRVSADPARRRDLTMRLGRLWAGPLARPDDAVAAFREVLTEEPGRPDAIEALEKHLQDRARRLDVARFLAPQYEAARSFPKLAWVLQIVIEETREGVERFELLRRLARIYEEALGDPEAAFRTLSEAVTEFPEQEDLWSDYGRLAEVVGDRRSEAERLERAFDSGRLSSDASLRLARRLAHIWEAVLGEPARAERYHRRILERSVDDAGSFASLDALFKGDERYADLAALLRDRADRTSSDDVRVDMLQQLAFLLEDVLDRSDDAVATYREILDVRPDHESAVRALERLYEQRERWGDLEALLERTVGVVRHESGVDRRLRIADLRERRLDRKAAALDDYRDIATERPDDPRLVAAFERLLAEKALRQDVADILAPLYERQGKYADLVRILQVKLEAASTAGDRVTVWTRVAQIREDALTDLDGAFEAYAQAVEADPSNPDTRRQLSRIADAQGLHALQADVLEDVLGKVGDDAPLRAEILAKLAGLYDEALVDAPRAEGAYRRLLAADPDDAATAVPAAVALERLFAARERHADLVDVLRIQARFADKSDLRAALLKRIAEIQETFLSAPADALATLEEIDDLAPSDVENLRALERLYSQTGSWAKLIDVLRRRCALASDAGDRRTASYRIAELLEEKLADRDEAIVAYQGILASHPSDVPAVRALERLFTAGGQWSDLLDALRRLLDLAASDSERVQALCRMGEVQHKHLKDAAEAVESYRRAIELDPHHGPARDALDRLAADEDVRLRVSRILAPLFAGEGQWADLLRMVEIEIADAEDDAVRTAALRRAAEVAEIGLGDSRRAFGYLGEALRRLAGTPDAGAVVSEVERLAGVLGDSAAVTALFREVVPDVVDPSIQTAMLLRIASAAKDGRDLAAAIEYYSKALDNDPACRPALDALEEVHAAAQRWQDLLEVYRRKADMAGSPSERVALLFLQARLCEQRLDDASAATTCYESVLEIDPSDRDAAAALEGLYAGAERWGALLDLLERRLSWPGVDGLAIRHRIGEIAIDKLGDPPRAFRSFGAVLEADSGYAPTLELLEGLLREGDHRAEAAGVLEDVYRRRMDLRKLVDVLQVKLEYAEDPEARKALLRKIGQFQEEQLENLDEAFVTYGRLCREDIDDVSSRELVERLAGVMGAWDRLADLYDAILRDADVETAATAAIASRLGDIAERRLKDLARARGAYRRAYSFDVSNAEALGALERVFAATEDWNALLDLLRQVCDGTYDPEARKHLLFQIASVQEEKLDSRPKAIETYVEVLDVDPSDARAIASLDRLYYYEKRWTDLVDLLTRRIEQAPDDAGRNALRYRVGSLYQEQLGDVDRAISSFEEILRADPGHREAIVAMVNLMANPDQRFRIAQSLEPVYRHLGEWESLVQVYLAQLENLRDPSDRIIRWLDIARLFEENLGDPRNAMKGYAEAFKEDPTDPGVLEQLQRLAGTLEAWTDLIPAIEAGIAKVDDGALKADLLRLVARTLDRRLGDFRGAAAAYERLIRIEPGDAETLEDLDALLTLLSDWERLVAVLDLKAEATADVPALKTIRQRQAEVCEEQIGKIDAAIDFYRKALDLDESDLGLYESVARLLERRERYAELVETLQRKLTVLVDPAGRRDAMIRVALCLRDRLADSAGAVRAYRALLEEFPSDLETLEALDTLYSADRSWHDLADVLVRKLDAVRTDAERLALRLRLGALCRGQIEDAQGAIDHFEQALALAPENEDAVSALREIAADEDHRMRVFAVLEPVLRRRARWEHLLELRRMRLAVMDDPAVRVEEMGHIAYLLERALDRPADALDAHLQAIREEAASDSAVVSAERLAGQLGRWADLAEALRVKAKATADAASAVALWRSVGAICEGRLDDPERAVDAYRAALDSGDEELPLDALDRLYSRLGRWDDLAEILERKLSVAVDPRDQSATEMRIARLRIEKYSDSAGALAAARSVIERTPDDREATALLETLVSNPDHLPALIEILGPVYRARGDQRKLLDLMERRVAQIGDADERVAMLREMATLAEEDLRDHSAAFRCLARAFEAAPEESGLLEDLERLGEMLADYATLVALASAAATRVDDRERQAALHSRCGRWSVRVRDDARAVEAYRAVLGIEPDSADALRELEGALRRLDRHADLADVIDRRAAATYDLDEKKALLRSLAALCVERLDDRARAAAAYDRILEADESDPGAIDSAIALREGLGQWPAVVALLRRRLALSPDVREANELRRRIGAACLGPLAEEQEGLDALREILEYEPDDPQAMGTLEDYYARCERWSDLRDLLRDRLDRAPDAAARAPLLRRLSELAETRLETPEDALDFAMQILDHDRKDSWARGTVERLLGALKRWDDLVMQFETWAREAEGSDPAEELRLLVKIGEIREREMDDPDGAVEYFERVLGREPNHTSALSALARIHERKEDWAKCVEVLERAAQGGGTPSDVSAVYLRLGKVKAERLDDVVGALYHYQQAVQVDPESRTAVDAVLDLARSVEQWPTWAAYAEYAVRFATDDAARAAALLGVARVQADRLDDAAKALHLLESARALAPDDLDVLVALADRYTADGRTDESIPILERLIDQEAARAGGKRRGKESAVYLLRLARALEARGDVDAAAGRLEEAAKIDVTNVAAAFELGRLYFRRKNHEKAGQRLRPLLLQKIEADSGVDKADVYWMLAQIHIEKGEKPKAISMLERGLQANPDHAGCKESLASLR